MNTKEYKVVNGTSYDARTPEELIKVLESCRANDTRIVINYGDTSTGKSWNETCDTVGRIERSNGNIKIPILLHNKRSIGGTGILDYCILEIKTSLGKKVLYKHSLLKE